MLLQPPGWTGLDTPKQIKQVLFEVWRHIPAGSWMKMEQLGLLHMSSSRKNIFCYPSGYWGDLDSSCSSLRRLIMSLSPVGGIRRVHAALPACYTEAVRQRNQLSNGWRLSLGKPSAAGKAGEGDERADPKPFFERAPVPVVRQVFPAGSSKQTCKLLDVQEEAA